MVMDILKREAVYLWYYSSVQFEQIAGYWILGMLIGSVISVFAKDRIHRLFAGLSGRRLGIFGIVIASALGILSPLCMYGTIPVAASVAENGMEEDWLASFMMSSVLLNPQLLIYSSVLGTELLLIRLASCFLGGILAGLLVRLCGRKAAFFDFSKFSAAAGRDTDPNIALRLLKNLVRNVRATGGYFLLGIVLSALFQRYVPADAFASLFGKHEGFGVLMAAAIGVPLYMCGGGTIPILMQWLAMGMSKGAAAAFMIMGPATKITNLGALKIVLGARHFTYYLLFAAACSLALGWAVNMVF